MNSDQFQTQLKKVVQAIVDNYQPEKIILFGSAVDGHIHEDSDADIVVIKDTGINFYDRISDVKSVIPHKIPIDVLVYTPQEFDKMKNDKYGYFIKDEVIGKGKVLYESN
jgi:predicted nucleotidyltransferase